MQRRQGGIAGHGFDAGHGFREPLRQAFAPTRVAPGLDGHACGHEHDHQGRRANGGELLVLSELALDPVPKAGGTGQDGLPSQEPVQVISQGFG